MTETMNLANGTEITFTNDKPRRIVLVGMPEHRALLLEAVAREMIQREAGYKIEIDGDGARIAPVADLQPPSLKNLTNETAKIEIQSGIPPFMNRKLRRKIAAQERSKK